MIKYTYKKIDIHVAYNGEYYPYLAEWSKDEFLYWMLENEINKVY